jgi:RNA ligase (TIGR02306 family)
MMIKKKKKKKKKKKSLKPNKKTRTKNKEKNKMRKFATLRKVDSTEPIPGAERVELAHVDGWRCVVLKGEFQPGEEVVFIEADAAIKNLDDPRFEFLRKTSYRCWKDPSGTVLDECYRIKTIKIAGQFSQGMVLKKSAFEKELQEAEATGKSLDEILNIAHFDELDEELQAITGARSCMDTRGTFTTLVPKTDLERIQNLPEFFEKHRDTAFEVTIKYDGMSTTVGYSPSKYPEEPFFICSRNNMLKNGSDNAFCRVAKKLNLEDILKAHYEATGHELILQGELCGPKIQSNRGKFTEERLFVFQIFDVTDCKWYSPSERFAFCTANGLDHVRVVSEYCKVFQQFDTIEKLISTTYMDGENGTRAEGLVFKSMDGKVDFKVLNPQYLMKNQ